MPKLHNFTFDAGKLAFWHRFKKLEKLRNEIVHSKDDLLYVEEIQDDTFFISNLFYRITNEKVLESAREVIEYLSKKIGDVPQNPREFQ